MSLAVTQLVGFGAAEAGTSAATITKTDNAVDGSATTTYTFTNKAIGTAATGRRIIVGVSSGAGSSATISSLTIGGNAATQVAFLDGTVSLSMISAIYILQVDTGTTATIVVTFSGSRSSCGVGVWAAYDLQSSTATFTGTSSGSPPSVGSVSCNAGGVIVAQSIVYAGSTPTFTWSGLTERFDEQLVSQVAQTGASDAFASAQSGVTVTSTPSITRTNASLSVAAFR